MVGIKVQKSVQGDSRCFYMVKDDGGEEDVSMKKCIDAVELNPPYVKMEKRTKEEGASCGEVAKKEGGEVAKPEVSKDGQKAEESKEENPKTEEAKEEKKEENQ